MGRFAMLEKNKIIEIWEYNNEHNISDFMFPLVWDIMFNQMFISNEIFKGQIIFDILNGWMLESLPLSIKQREPF